MNRSALTLSLIAACGGDYELALDQDAVIPNCPLNWNCFWVTNTLDSGAGSLRQAIDDAEAQAGIDRILFGIAGAGPHVITTTGFVVTAPIFIDGYSQAGSSRATSTAPAQIQVVLESTGLGTTGLNVATNDCVVQGLAIAGFGVSGVTFAGEDNTVRGCYIGTDDTGSVPAGNGVGVNISGARNTVGGLTPADRNIIADSVEHGVHALDCLDCRIIGNHIGTDPAATLDLGNRAGVRLAGSTPILVGGVELGARNVISGNVVGIEILSDDNRVEGNFIGINASATLGGIALANGDGVAVLGTGNVIGGTAAGAGNIISNHSYGFGVEIYGDQNRVEGNRIGTNAAGSAALGNEVGVVLFGNQNTVGGASAAARNILSGNEYQGVMILPFSVFGTAPSDNLVQGNFIGLNFNGTLPLGNGAEGVLVQDGVDNLIGGSAAGTGNTIGGNGGDGVRLEPSALGTSNRSNAVQGNQIGTDAAGRDLGNAGSGVSIAGGLNHWVGGPLVGDRNRISNNALDGVWVESGTGHGVLGNSIWNNDDLSIDLGATGPTANDGLGDPDTGANDLQNSPVIDSVTRSLPSANIGWSLQTEANRPVLVELFASAACRSPNRAHAERLLTATYVTTDATGFASGLYRALNLPAGEWVTATASEVVGLEGRNTSEVSRCFKVP